MANNSEKEVKLHQRMLDKPRKVQARFIQNNRVCACAGQLKSFKTHTPQGCSFE